MGSPWGWGVLQGPHHPPPSLRGDCCLVCGSEAEVGSRVSAACTCLGRRAQLLVHLPEVKITQGQGGA